MKTRSLPAEGTYKRIAMNKNKYLLLCSSAGVLLLLVIAAIQENFLKQWRQIQSSARAEAGPVDVRLRQVVVPALGVKDRCVSCHVGMAAGEQGVTGSPAVAPHSPLVHDPSEFGCTVCHGGQGRATEMADAHGEAPFWPKPMIPLRYADAGCGSCHTHLRVPHQDSLRLGQNLVERYDCLACHRLDSRGGTLRPGGAGGMEGPDLSAVGLSGYDAAWYAKHLQHFEQAAEGPWRTSFGPINEVDRKTIDEYLDSRTAAPKLVEAKALFHSLGCRGCHKIGGVGGSDGPDLSFVGERDPGRLDFTHVPGERAFVNWLAEHFRNPPKVVPGSRMPILGLSEEQIDLLNRYMLSLRRSSFPEAYWPKDRIRAERLGEREFATDGATLFGTFCAACHGPKGGGMRYPGSPPFPANGNPDFLAVASDEFLTQTIVHGRPGRRMPAWGEQEGGLRPEEISALVAHLRRLGGVEAPPPDPRGPRWVKADAKTGEQIYVRLCAGCHGTKGEGIDAPALNNQALLNNATDTYLVETIGRGRRATAMPAFREAALTHPVLSDRELEAIVAFIRQWETTK
jgi:cbb3-type cytochrome c oxidase subunit III